MSHDIHSDENIPNDEEACYELVASQEEVYLEETEEELRAILIFDNSCAEKNFTADASNSPRTDQGNNEKVEHEIEELITGDSDDVPLSDKEIEEMVRPMPARHGSTSQP